MDVALLESVTLAPPVGATFESVIVQVVVEDAVRLALGHCSEFMTGGAVTVRVTDWVIPLKAALIVAVWSAVTATAVAVKFAVEAV